MSNDTWDWTNEEKKWTGWHKNISKTNSIHKTSALIIVEASQAHIKITKNTCVKIVNTTHNSEETICLLDKTGSRMMPPPGLQIYLLPCVTLSFDSLTSWPPKFERFMPLPTCANVYQNQFIRFQHNVFTRLVKDKPDERTDGQRDGRTDGQ